MAALSVWLAVYVWRAEGPVGLDRDLRWILEPWGQHRLPSGQGSFRWAIAGYVAGFGSAPAFAAGSAVIVLVAAVWKDARGVIYCLVALPAVAGVVELLAKEVVHRTRYGSLSYPSMHAAGAAALATAGVLILHRRAAGRAILLGAAACSAVFVGSVSLAIVYRGFHEPTDVVGGVATGAAVALLAAAAVFGVRPDRLPIGRGRSVSGSPPIRSG